MTQEMTKDMTKNITAQAITLRTVPALAGWLWITRGWQLLKANPIHIHIAFFFFLSALFVVSMIPWLGSVLAAMLMPALYLGVMATIAKSEHSSSAQPTSLLDALGSPFKKDANGQRSVFKRLANLGLVYTLVVFVVLSIYSFVMGGDVLKGMMPIANNPSAATPAAIEAAREQLIIGFLGLLAAYAPVSLAFWFTQQLVGWHGQSLTKALFFSWMGCWRNKSAFTVFILAWFAIFMACAFAMTGLASVLGASSLVAILITPVTLFLMVWVFCSFYASYESLVHVVE